MIGAYFSKPDWHSEYYWWPKYATANRNNNYDIRKYPWRWNKFKDYTFNQIGELMNGYGNIDILWLDGGWVRPLETVNDEVRAWGAAIPEWSQDIDMSRIASMARKAQPGILFVDRTVKGAYENYQTPEQHIPDKPLDYPWESCVTLGNDWGYVPTDKYKSATNIIHTLIEIVAKGGSMLLGVGPRPDGTLSEEQIQKLKEIGTWLNINGQAIYDTRTSVNYRDGETFFTQSHDGKTRFAITRVMGGAKIPLTIEWNNNQPVKGSKIILLSTRQPVKWKCEGSKTIITLPKSITNYIYPALAFSFINQN
jgi:alpha-L-fucosidase